MYVEADKVIPEPDAKAEFIDMAAEPNPIHHTDDPASVVDTRFAFTRVLQPIEPVWPWLY